MQVERTSEKNAACERHCGEMALPPWTEVKGEAMNLFNLIRNEAGQDLVEYALVVALIACGAIAGMSSVASSINTVFGVISSDIAISL